MNKFTEIIYILNKEKLPNIPTKSLIVQYAFHCYLKEENLSHKILVFPRMEKGPFLKHIVYWFYH